MARRTSRLSTLPAGGPGDRVVVRDAEDKRLLAIEKGSHGRTVPSGLVPEFDRFLALSFDCYGTLIDWERGIIDALRPWVAGASRSATLTDEELLTAFSEVESDEESADPARYPEILARVMRRLGQRFAIPVSDEQATAFGASIPAWP